MAAVEFIDEPALRLNSESQRQGAFDVGSSKDSIEDAIQTAIKRANATLRNLRWFEVIQTRGHVENGQVSHYQVVLKAGFTLEAGDQ
jgi:flavin-binding protein dodecin